MILVFVVPTSSNTGVKRYSGPPGIVTTGVGLDSQAGAIAVQPNGRIVAAGTSSDSFTASLALVRLTRRGALDRGFGEGGKAALEIGGQTNDLALQSDGKILAAGSNAREQILARFMPNGALDSTFDRDGILRAEIEEGFGGTSIAIQPDQRIIVAGPRFTLARYKPDGARDATFGGDGIVTTGSLDSWANAVGLQPDGRILAAGGAFVGSGRHFMVARYDSDGSPDPTFGQGGTVTSAFASDSEDEASALVVQPDGKVVVVGQTTLGTDDHFAVARYNADGSLDATFGGDGMVTTALSAGAGSGVLSQDGKLVAVGDMFVVRYLRDGSLDPSFGRNGIVTTRPSPGRYFAAYDVALQVDGRIISAGKITADRDLFAVARYKTNGSLDSSFGGRECAVPKVVGLVLARAKARIVAAGCRVGEVSRHYSPKQRGRVLRQTPRAGAHVALHTAVGLVVSRGPKR